MQMAEPENENGAICIKASGTRIKVPLKYVAGVLALLGLPGTAAFLGTHFGKPAEAVVPAAVLTTSTEFASHQRDDERQGEAIGDLQKRQAADHDALTTLGSDVRHIKETVDRIDQSLRRQGSRTGQ